MNPVPPVTNAFISTSGAVAARILALGNIPHNARMANPGDVLDNPITGQSLTFRRTTAETGGELLEVESRWEPAGQEPPEHYHPHQEEHFEVLEGELRARVGETEQTLHAGETLDVPAATPHTMWNPGPGRARAVWQTRPALQTEAFFEMVFGLAQAGASGGEVPDPDRAAAMLSEFADVFRIGRPDAG
jgi:quercetin dioxygenase-like cupin family protein